MITLSDIMCKKQKQCIVRLNKCINLHFAGVNWIKILTCNLQVEPLYLEVPTKTSLITIVTSPGYKCPVSNYRCSTISVKDGKYQIW